MDQKNFAKHLRRNMTDAEKLLWRHLRSHRLAGQKFRRQQPLGSYVVDFVHFGARLVVEADGGQHNAASHDVQRDEWLRSQGFRVLRFWNNEILLNTDDVLAVIFEAVNRVSPSPPAPLPRGERGDGGSTSAHVKLSDVHGQAPSPLAGEGWGEGAPNRSTQ